MTNTVSDTLTTETGKIIPLVLISLISAAFFSSTFVLNYSMALGSGHWVWTAILRYIFTIILVTALITTFKGWHFLFALGELFFKHIAFWIIAGTLACGLFYSGIAFSSEILRGWMVAATWQFTIIASPLVLYLFGYKFPVRALFIAVAVFAGIILINAQNFLESNESFSHFWAYLPILISTFAYPLGNQLLNSAKNNGISFVPTINSPLLENPFSGILLLSIGSIPFWTLLFLIAQPPAPLPHQYLQTFAVAVLAGVLATGLFYYARNATSDPYKIIAVDAVQSTEVLFALAFELILINSLLPTYTQIAGTLVVVLGIFTYGLFPSQK